jgi:predicted GIY-YIG superfamily endonuclease
LPYYLYILASGPRGTLYVGVTNDLIRRVYEHRNHLIGGFTEKYRVTRLVFSKLMTKWSKPSSMKSASSAGVARGRLN